MKCDECGEPMTSARENYSYTASGLPYVTLVGVEVRRCKACGEHEVVIPKIELLHRTIALLIVGKKTRLTAAEVRFLRKYLGWSGVDFAKHMGVTPESVSRWENDREQMGPVADRLLRLMVVTRSPVSDYELDTLADLEDESAPLRLRVEPARNGWRAEGGAAA
jgi:putative zinc finger/helix-turn-helix YgiT family protein